MNAASREGSRSVVKKVRDEQEQLALILERELLRHRPEVVAEVKPTTQLESRDDAHMQSVQRVQVPITDGDAIAHHAELPRAR